MRLSLACLHRVDKLETSAGRLNSLPMQVFNRKYSRQVQRGLAVDVDRYLRVPLEGVARDVRKERQGESRHANAVDLALS